MCDSRHASSLDSPVRVGNLGGILTPSWEPARLPSFRQQPHDGARLGELIDHENTDLWADTSYRSAKNEALLAKRRLVSRIHRKKPRGRPMAQRTRQANARKSAVRAAVEHVFAYQKGPMALRIRTIGLVRAQVKIGLANLAYNMRRYIWLSRRPTWA